MNLIPQTLLDGFVGNDPLIPRFKNVLRQFSECQNQLFSENCPIEQLVQSRARFIDYLLKQAWTEFIQPAPDNIALVAVGGYGRGELHPASDIDLMVLLAESEDGSHNESIQSLLTFLWDIGLDIGHSVRSIQDCITEAEKDITVQTNLVEARLLCGPDKLFEQMKRVTGPDRFWPSDQFFQAKWDEQKQRYHKYHDTAYNLEPNIKESPGGLRDIQVIGWVAKRHFQTATLYSLVEHRFLTQTEYRTLIEGQNLLWRIRFALHTLTGRREDRLLFDHQLALALQFGYQDGDNNLAIEQFMQHYYRTVMELERLNEMLLQLFQDEILSHGHIDKPIVVNERFQIRNGFLEVTSEQVFAQQPTALLEMFLIMAGDQNLKGVRAGTIRLIRSASHLIDDTFRKNAEAKKLFIELFRRPEGLTHELRRMNRYGILAAYLPVFANIVGRMQYDLFHVYTVDEHTLFVVRNMRRFTVKEFSHEFPLCSSLIHTLPKPELLYIAGLFHDIAKGRGGDHSVLGAKDAYDFCIDHGIDEDGAQLVVWLVRSHLIMSVTAQRRDISDPEVVRDFAQMVQNQLRLDYIYLLTVADIRATNPEIWNSWKDSLLRQLYNSCRRMFERGMDEQVSEDHLITTIRNQASIMLQKDDYAREQTDRIWQDLPNEYFLSHSAEEIVWHTECIAQAQPGDLPLISLRPSQKRGSTDILIYGPVKDHQFAVVTALIENMGLNVVGARIDLGVNKHSLDSFQVLEENGDIIQNQDRLAEIQSRLFNGLHHVKTEPVSVNRHIPRRIKHFDIPTTVTFAQDEHNARTILRVNTRDRTGILSGIGKAFMAEHILLQNARIATIGAQAEDTFDITDMDNQQLASQTQLDALRDRIMEVLDN